MKEKDDEPEFTNLRSDTALRQNVAKLTFENSSDERGAAEILKQSTLCKSNRVWLNSLVARNGKKFELVEKKKK
jgi:hypothetical protein